MLRSAIFTLFLLFTLPLSAAEKEATYITTDQAAHSTIRANRFQRSLTVYRRTARSERLRAY